MLRFSVLGLRLELVGLGGDDQRDGRHRVSTRGVVNAGRGVQEAYSIQGWGVD